MKTLLLCLDLFQFLSRTTSCVSLTLKTSVWSRRDTRTRLLGAYSWAGWSTSGLSSSSASLGSPFCSWTDINKTPSNYTYNYCSSNHLNIRCPIYTKKNKNYPTHQHRYVISARARHKPADSPRTPRRWSKRSNGAPSWCLWEPPQKTTEVFSLEPAAIRWADRTERDAMKLKICLQKHCQDHSI